MSEQECIRIPPGVKFERWHSDEWVIYHSGTGETMRLSDAAVALLDMLAESGPQDRSAVARALNDMMEVPLADAEIASVVDRLLRDLLAHECVELVSFV
jgi:PqqD family protein of HPr-rel-A system